MWGIVAGGRGRGEAPTRTFRFLTESIFLDAMELCSRMIWRCSSRMVRCWLMASS